MRAVALVLPALLVAALVGCESEGRAQRALDDARAAGAPAYAPVELARAEAALALARTQQGAARDDALAEARTAAGAALARAEKLAAKVTSARAAATAARAQREEGVRERKAAASAELAERRVDDTPLPDRVTVLRPREAYARVKADNLLLLDLRPTTASKLVRPWGAVPAPPSELRHARFPKMLDLVLVDAGEGWRGVARAAEVLRARGYRRLFAVRGGLEAWRAAGLPTDGEAPRATDVAVLLPTEAGEALAAPRTTIVDVRSERLWRAGHVPGAVHVAVGELEGAATTSLRGQRVIVYGADDAAGQRAAATLVRAGHADVRRLAGGLVAWARAGQRLDAAPAPTPVRVAERAPRRAKEVVR